MSNLPTIVSNVPRDVRIFLDRVREILNARDDNAVVKFATLVELGIVDQSGVMQAADGPFLPTPAAPTGLAVSGALASVVVTWDVPIYTGHSYTEIWAAPAPGGGGNPQLGDAVLVGMAPGAVFTHDLGGSATRWYWIRHVNAEGVAGAYNAVDGLQATTGDDPGYLMDVLSEAYGTGSASPYFRLDAPQTIGGVLVPAGTYMYDAFIYNGSITNAKIGDAAIDTAKIADASITTAKIGAAQITTALIDTAAITTAKIADAAVGTAQIGDAQITTAKIGDAQITNAKIAVAAVGTAQIGDAAITNAQIADATITGAKIGAATIDLANIDTASITSLDALSANLGSIEVGTANIAAASVGTLQIGNDAVVTDKMLDNTVTVFRSALSSSGNTSVSVTFTPSHACEWLAFLTGQVTSTNVSGPHQATVTLTGTTDTTELDGDSNAKTEKFSHVGQGVGISGVSLTITAAATGDWVQVGEGDTQLYLRVLEVKK